VAPAWMRLLARFDPVAYAVDLMRGSLIGGFFFPVWQSIAALGLTIAVLTAASVRVFNRGEDDATLGASRFNWRG